MFTPLISAQQFLEGGREPAQGLVAGAEGIPQVCIYPHESLTPSRYFSGGGSLRELNARVRELIQTGVFSEVAHQPLKEQVRARLHECIKFINKQQVPYSTETLVLYLWNQHWSHANGAEEQTESLMLWESLSEAALPPICPVTLVNSGKSLDQIIADISEHILRARNLPSKEFLKEVRKRFYHHLKVEWCTQNQTVSGFLFSSITTAFLKWKGQKHTSLERAFWLLKKIDEKLSKVVQPNAKSYGVDLNFKDCAWLTDKLLMKFAVEMLNTRKIDVRGCFQLTEQGVASVEAWREQVHRPLEIITDQPRCQFVEISEEKEGWVLVNTTGASKLSRRRLQPHTLHLKNKKPQAPSDLEQSFSDLIEFPAQNSPVG